MNILSFISRKILSRDYDKAIVVIDKNLFNAKRDYIKELFKSLGTLDIIFLEPKVSHKDFRNCDSIMKRLVDVKASRKSCLIAIGGGYVADMTGFIAANYMRGIDFIQIPSTLMSMADAVIGKVAIDYHGIKNLLGAFYSPRFVFCELSLLDTLKDDEIIFGLVEVWKHALLENNTEIANKINKILNNNENISLECYDNLIAFSLKTKKKYVQVDYNDTKDLHKALSLGHTFANYLESAMSTRHGSAVFYGLIFSCLLSYKLKTISKKQYMNNKLIAKSFEKKFCQLSKVQKVISIKKTIEKMKFDKINHHDQYSFVLLKQNGFYVEHNIDAQLLTECITDFKKIKL